jgi:hypothetical protein
MPVSDASRTLGQLLRGSLVTQLIHAAAKLGVADLLAEGPQSVPELATALHVDAQALYRVLRASPASASLPRAPQGCSD